MITDKRVVDLLDFAVVADPLDPPALLVVLSRLPPRVRARMRAKYGVLRRPGLGLVAGFFSPQVARNQARPALRRACEEVNWP